MAKAKVYFTRDISSEGLVRIYEALNGDLKGNVAVKISTGELGGHNYLKPELIKGLVQKLNGTIVECNTAYRGKRFNSADHHQVIEEHGFTKIAPVDIMDEEEDIEIPVNYDGHLKGINIVGSHIKNYDSCLMLSHFKGHAMGGFGGALKNMSIGMASSNGKAWIHSVGITKDPDEMWHHTDNQDGFLESMAEACKGIIDYFGKENMLYISIYASVDPVAIDKCSYDTIINSTDTGKASLIKRMEEKHAIHTVEEAEKLGLGTTDYEIIDLDLR